MRKLYWTAGSLIAAALAQTAFFYPRLPETVASHFDWAGQANGWSSKGAFFLIYCFVILLMIIMFFVLPTAFRRIPASLINLPNKDYWLNGDRKESTFLQLRSLMGWFGVSVLLFNIIMFQLAINANMSREKVLTTFVMKSLLAVFFVFVMIWLIGFYRKFKTIKDLKSFSG